MKPTKIEDLWYSLHRESNGAQRRIDADHLLDFYADFEPPERPGLVLLCPKEPPEYHSLNAIRVERRLRHDGRWSLRICLVEPKLMPVFTELCRDVVDSTRVGVEPNRAASIVFARIERWRALLQANSGRMNQSQLRGLLGELLVLEKRLFPSLGPQDAVATWTGPFGMAQDFHLPSGQKIEAKAVDRTQIT